MSATRIKVKKDSSEPPVSISRIGGTVTIKVENGGGQTTATTVSGSTTSTMAKTVKTSSATPQPQQQIYIIQTNDGNVPVDGNEVVVAGGDDMSVYETVSALEQLSRSGNGNGGGNSGNGAQIITTNDGGDMIQVYEGVVLPDGTTSNSALDRFVDVAEVEVGDRRSASPVKIGDIVLHPPGSGHGGPSGSRPKKKRQSAAQKAAAAAAAAAAASIELSDTTVAGGEFHICRICNQFVPLGDLGIHNAQEHGKLSELTCSDCGKLFKSKRSLFGHKKEKHSGVTEVHGCPECGKTFGRKSNLKAHRESLHYGKKFPCQYCERIFTNRSSMNQHVKKTHIGTLVAVDDGSFEMTA